MLWVLMGIHGINEFKSEKAHACWTSKPTFADLLYFRFSSSEIDLLLDNRTVKKISKWYLKQVIEGVCFYD